MFNAQNKIDLCLRIGSKDGQLINKRRAVFCGTKIAPKSNEHP